MLERDDDPPKEVGTKNAPLRPPAPCAATKRLRQCNMVTATSRRKNGSRRKGEQVIRGIGLDGLLRVTSEQLLLFRSFGRSTQREPVLVMQKE